MGCNMRQAAAAWLALVAGWLALAGAVWAEDGALSPGQTLYVPVYSRIYVGDRKMAFSLSANLSFRNTDPKHALIVEAIAFYDSEGKKLRDYLAAPVKVGPMGSHYIFVKPSDEAGGWGANFIVTWRADRPINPPIVESVMIGLRGSHSISFTSRGQAIAPSEQPAAGSLRP